MTAYRFDRCLLSPLRRELRVNGQTVGIQPLVFDMLIYFAERPGQVIEKKVLLSSVWRSPHVSESVVARAVMKARRAIGDDSKDPRILRTIPRIGYRFDARVELVVDEPVNSSGHENLDRSDRRGLVLLPFVNTLEDSELEHVIKGLTGLLHHLLLSQPGPGISRVALAAPREPGRPDDDVMAEACRHAGMDEALSCQLALEQGNWRLVAWRGSSRAAARSCRFSGPDVVRLVMQLARNLRKVGKPGSSAA